jgi:acyl carrier protein
MKLLELAAARQRFLEMHPNQDIEHELKALIVESLALEGIQAADIQPDAPLFVEGLGLDSIDALELGMAISKKYGIRMSADAAENRQHFSSVSALARYVQATLDSKTP